MFSSCTTCCCTQLFFIFFNFFCSYDTTTQSAHWKGIHVGSNCIIYNTVMLVSSRSSSFDFSVFQSTVNDQNVVNDITDAFIVSHSCPPLTCVSLQNNWGDCKSRDQTASPADGFVSRFFLCLKRVTQISVCPSVF